MVFPHVPRDEIRGGLSRGLSRTGIEGSDGTDGCWRIARQVARDRVISTVDPQARHVHKSVHRGQDGYKAHIAVEPDTGIITDCALTQANGAANHEATVGLALLEGEDTPVTVLADSAYGSGEFRPELIARGHRDRVKPAPLRAAVPGGFSVDDFSVDHLAATVTCPAGLTRSISDHGYATFGVACLGCSLQTLCTTSATCRSLKLRPNDAMQRIARQQARNPQWLNEYRQHRPMVEVPSRG